MFSPLIAAWAVAEGILIYRSVKKHKAPPGPGQLLYASGAFVILGLMAESPSLRPLATTVGWGLVAAAFMHLTEGIDTLTQKDAPQASWPPGMADSTEIIPTGT